MDPIAEPTLAPVGIGEMLGGSELDPSLKMAAYKKDIEYQSGSGGTCIAKKRIVLDLKNTILGHRLLTLASAALLANIMDRALEIEWDINPKIPRTF
jgi:hypothetical protein